MVFLFTQRKETKKETLPYGLMMQLKNTSNRHPVFPEIATKTFSLTAEGIRFLQKAGLYLRPAFNVYVSLSVKKWHHYVTVNHNRYIYVKFVATLKRQEVS